MLIVALAALVHVVPYGRAVWDFVFVLDGAYRIGLGQVPHVDFASPIGALTLYLTHLAERLFPGGQPFIGLHALAWLIVVPPFAVIASRIRSAWGFAASFAILAVVVLVPYTLDSTMLSEISYFATYNRFATAILFLAALWYVLPKARGDGVLLGYLLTALIFIKITAAIAMLGLVVAAVLLGRARPAALFAMLFVAARGGTGRTGDRRPRLRLPARHRLDERIEPGRLALPARLFFGAQLAALVVTHHDRCSRHPRTRFHHGGATPVRIRARYHRAASLRRGHRAAGRGSARRGEPEHRRRRIDCRARRTFPPEPAR